MMLAHEILQPGRKAVTASEVDAIMDVANDDGGGFRRIHVFMRINIPGTWFSTKSWR